MKKSWKQGTVELCIPCETGPHEAGLTVLVSGIFHILTIETECKQKQAPFIVSSCVTTLAGCL